MGKQIASCDGLAQIARCDGLAQIARCGLAQIARLAQIVRCHG